MVHTTRRRMRPRPIPGGHMIRVSRWFACVLVAGAVQEDEPLFAVIFSDHMVLQRDRTIDVFGRATPGEQVSVSMAVAARTTQADSSGACSPELPTLHVGGPHALVAT